MKKLATSALAVLMAFSAAIPVATTSAEARNRGAKIAGGIILGAAALAIIANSNRANAGEYRRSGDYGRRDGWRSQCRRWYNRCQDGSNWACEKFETRGCTE